MSEGGEEMAWLAVSCIDEGELVETVAADLSVRASVSKIFYCESDTAVTQDAFLTASAGGTTVAALLESYSAGRTNCRVRRRRVQQETSHKGKVICEYEDPTDGTTTANLPNIAARFSSRPESFMEGYSIDALGAKVTNSANEVFDQAPERQAGVKVYVIRKYVSATTKGQIEAAWNTTNQNQVTIDGKAWASNEAWLADYSFERVDGATMWDASIVIKCKDNGWVDAPLDVGFRTKDGNEIRIKSGAIDPTGDPVAKPWPLNSNGTAKAASSSGAVPDAKTFYPYEKNVWTGVPLS